MSKSAVSYDWDSRIDRARTLMSEQDLDALYVTAGSNQFYFTGFSALEGGWPIWLSAYILPLEGEPAFVLSDMHRDIMKHAETSMPADAVTVCPDGEDPRPVLENIFRDRGLEDGNIGVESDTWFDEGELLREIVPDGEVVSAAGVFDRLRMVKDDREIENLRRANEIAAETFAAAAETIEAGRSQRQVAQDITSAMLEAGSESMGLIGSFSDLHGREFEEGDVVDVDMLPQYNQYVTDCARNVFVGDPKEEHRRAYETCVDCLHATMDVVEPGVTAHEVHTFAEEYMNDAGYEQPWKIGHGIGLMEGHEAPMVQSGDETVLEPGMVITIDPGFFIEDQAHDVPIHVEDPVLVTKDGCESLIDYTYDVVTV